MSARLGTQGFCVLSSLSQPHFQHSGQGAHRVESTVLLSAPHNPCTITLAINGENESLTRIIHDMCRMAINHAIEPLQQNPRCA